MLGTAFPASRLLLVEQPGPWGRNGLTDSHLDPAIAAELERRAGAAGFRVLAIRRPGRTPAGLTRRFGLVDTRDGRQQLRWGRFDDDAALLDLRMQHPDAVAAEPDRRPAFLVCAHAKHDACCALRGRPVAAALDALRPGQVWECSHVGGDRFAANVLVVPTGMLYGRVTPQAAAELARAADADEVLPRLLRGRVGLSGPAQAALAHAHAQLGTRRRGELRVRSVGPMVDGSVPVVVDTPEGPIRVDVAVERIAASGLTCANPRPNAFMRYRPVRLAAAEPGSGTTGPDRS